jgi:hypothetical protein
MAADYLDSGCWFSVNFDIAFVIEAMDSVPNEKEWPMRAHNYIRLHVAACYHSRPLD